VTPPKPAQSQLSSAPDSALVFRGCGDQVRHDGLITPFRSPPPRTASSRAAGFLACERSARLRPVSPASASLLPGRPSPRPRTPPHWILSCCSACLPIASRLLTFAPSAQPPAPHHRQHPITAGSLPSPAAHHRHLLTTGRLFATADSPSSATPHDRRRVRQLPKSLRFAPTAAIPRPPASDRRRLPNTAHFRALGAPDSPAGLLEAATPPPTSDLLLPRPSPPPRRSSQRSEGHPTTARSPASTAGIFRAELRAANDHATATPYDPVFPSPRTLPAAPKTFSPFRRRPGHPLHRRPLTVEVANPMRAMGSAGWTATRVPAFRPPRRPRRPACVPPRDFTLSTACHSRRSPSQNRPRDSPHPAAAVRGGIGAEPSIPRRNVGSAASFAPDGSVFRSMSFPWYEAVGRLAPSGSRPAAFDAATRGGELSAGARTRRPPPPGAAMGRLVPGAATLEPGRSHDRLRHWGSSAICPLNGMRGR